MARVVIFGTSGFAEMAHFYFTHDSEHEVVGFCLSADRITEPEYRGLPVHPFEQLTESHPPGDFAMFVAVGYGNVNKSRAEIYEQAKAKGYELITYVSSKATIWEAAENEIGDNCFIFEDNTIQPYAKLGNDVVLWSGNHVGHWAEIGDHCFIASHVVISGHVKIGAYSFLGVNATLRDDIKIGESNVIGSGAVVMKDTADNEVYAPARTKPRDVTSDQIEL
jgi:sugar O-acyltransferase (sialic acid O-acetyltransferase NeuD family)